MRGGFGKENHKVIKDNNVFRRLVLSGTKGKWPHGWDWVEQKGITVKKEASDSFKEHFNLE